MKQTLTMHLKRPLRLKHPPPPRTPCPREMIHISNFWVENDSHKRKPDQPKAGDESAFSALCQEFSRLRQDFSARRRPRSTCHQGYSTSEYPLMFNLPMIRGYSYNIIMVASDPKIFRLRRAKNRVFGVFRVKNFPPATGL